VSTPTDVVAWLRALVACNTQNPPRTMAGFQQLFSLVTPHLEANGFVVVVRDLGEGCCWLHAVRGAPTWLVNIHVDTVPAAPGWQGDPHVLVTSGERLVGLGSADTKGALASFLVAVADSNGPAALLLTSDEEAGSSRCVRTFVAEHDVRGMMAIVAEPTQVRAVFGHRGIATCAATFSGTPGHASLARAYDDSAVHEGARWSSAALLWAKQQDEASRGVRFNIGVFEGGQKANMIAGSCVVRFGVRPPPGSDSTAVLKALMSCAARPERVSWQPGYVAPPLPAPGRSDAQARERLRGLGVVVEEGAPVDFFTEAALFSEAGADAVVLGAGDIGVAHAPGESVPMDDLRKLTTVYRALMSPATETT
jgi:acetylornithine deacetylase